MSDQSRRPVFFWLVLLTCMVYAGLFAFTVYAVARYYGVEKDSGWSVTRTDGRAWFVTHVDDDGPAAGRIEVGDRLLAINGDERRAGIGFVQWVFVDGGKTYTVDLDRSGERVSVEMPMALVPGQRLTPIYALVGLVFFVCGAMLALLRPQDPQVRLAGAFLMSVGFVTLLMTQQSTFTFLVGWEMKVHYLVAPLSIWTLPLAYHFFSRFPVWRSPGLVWRIIQWLLYAVFVLVMWPAFGIIIFLGYGVSEAATNFMAAHPSIYMNACLVSGWPFAVYTIVCFGLSFVVTARNYRRLADPDSRRRIQWVIVGVMIAVIPFVGLTFAFSVAGWGSERAYNTYSPLSFLAMLCIPVSIGAAGWKDQLFDIRVLVRRGLQYLFAKVALRVLLALPIALLLLSIISNPNRTIAQILTQGSGWLNVVLIGGIGATLYWRRRVQKWLDPRFFREDYQQEQVLVHLIDEVRQRDSVAEIAQLVTARIDSVLHPTAVHIFYRAKEDSEFVSGRSASQSATPPSSQQVLSEQQTLARVPGGLDDAPTQQHLSQQEMLLRMLDGSKAIRVFASVFDELPENERAWLENLSVRLIVPITGTRDRLVGVLLLGARMSDEPYSTTDRRLLEGIAAQIGLVYENQHLRERVRLDADVRRDVLGRLEDQGVNLLKECPKCSACYDSTADHCEQDGAELMLTLPIERTLDGKYRLERSLGRGGFGVVYEATDVRLQRRVAAKVMMGSSFGDVTAIRRFEREARAAARIDHRHITRVHDYGAIGSGGAYLIMELVSGRTWREELKRSGVIAPARAAEWFRQLLEGLQFAHKMGVVHRDLKPENVMIVEALSGADELKVMDFGLAKVLDGGTGVTESLTKDGAVMGTFGYMAPEVFTGGPVDERADIFAIGVMTVETLVGERPFCGQTTHEVLTSLLNSEYHMPGDSVEIRGLDAVLQRCIAKDPRDRYGSVTEVANELVPALARCAGIEARKIVMN